MASRGQDQEDREAVLRRDDVDDLVDGAPCQKIVHGEQDRRDRDLTGSVRLGHVLEDG